MDVITMNGDLWTVSTSVQNVGLLN